MADFTRDKGRFQGKRILGIFKNWLQAELSIYPPNLYNVVEWKTGKISLQGHNKIVGLTKKDYQIYYAVSRKYKTIVFEFVPIRKREAKLLGSKWRLHIED
jgi:hypothetical protein